MASKEKKIVNRVLGCYKGYEKLLDIIRPVNWRGKDGLGASCVYGGRQKVLVN